MASPTKHTQSVRRAKMTKRGQARKRLLRTKGSTPRFPIHPDKGEGGKG